MLISPPGLTGVRGRKRVFEGKEVYWPHDARNGKQDKRGEAKGMNLTPSEFAIGGVYFPPLLIAAFFGVVAAVLTAYLLNRYRLSRFFYYPPVVFLALAVIYTSFIGTFVIPS